MPPFASHLVVRLKSGADLAVRWGFAAVLVVGVVLTPGCNRKKSGAAASATSTKPLDRHRALADRGASRSNRPFSLPADLGGTNFDAVKLRFVAFGDSGIGTAGQAAVAVGLANFCAKSRCDLALHLGDIIYPEGIKSAEDPALELLFERPYASLGAPIWLSLGNHDHYGNAQAWLDAYGPKGTRVGAGRKPEVHLPAPYYTFVRGGVRFLALDTDKPTLAQAQWADEVLRQARRGHDPWIVVFGHHPRKSNGAHRGATEAFANFFDRVLCHRADLYLAGHDHDKQLLKPHCGVHLVVAGTGGQLRPVDTEANTVFAKSSLGFASFVAARDTMKVQFIDPDGKQEFERTLTRHRPIPVCNKDMICNGMCSKDPDCTKGKCAADKRCDQRCTDDPDCTLGAKDSAACACDRVVRICEVHNSEKGTICACDPACQAGIRPCIADGHCDSNCRKLRDPDCETEGDNR